MPCYLSGRIVLQDIDRLRSSAYRFGITIEEKNGLYIFHKNNEVILSTPIESLTNTIYGGQLKITELLKGISRQYNILQIKLTAQRKGWQVSNIKQEEDRIIIKVRE